MNSFSHTNDNTPWWQVELVSTSTIQQIKIENRFCGDANDQTGCLCRLSRAKLSLLDDRGLVVAEQNIDDTCGELTVTLKFDNTFACSGEVRHCPMLNGYLAKLDACDFPPPYHQILIDSKPNSFRGSCCSQG
jgi:hypothetical protein